ncbi:hypothetical protein [Acidovorax sp. BL-A-41-H1]|uniref:hypothetical protein n=1 Tax=Acidovorax sp. BL-A-41-H1 TaxID=3421102 RepID=UPI003F7AF722
MAGLDPKTGIYTYADGSTYQNPHNYGTADRPSWALTGAQVGSMMGDQGAAVNAANGWDSRPVWQGGSGTQDLSGIPGGGAGSWGASAPAGGGAGGAGVYNNKPMQMGGAPGGQGGAMGGGGSFGGAPSGQNPYLSQMGDVMAGQMTQNFNRKVMPQISSQMMATGGFGGSRQGVIEANAMNDLNGQIGNALTNLYGQGFNTSLNYDLGLRNNDLGFAGLDAQINQNNFNNRLNGANFGLGIYDRQQQGNQAGINAGTNIQNTPMNYWSQFSNQYNGIGQGYGTTTGSSSQQGNPIMGALGGAQLGSRIAGGMGNIGGSSSATQGWTYGGSGTNRGPSDNIDWIYG